MDHGKARKTVTQRLSSGQRVEFTAQESRMLKIAYDYLSGFHKRSLVEVATEKQREKVSQMYAALPPQAKTAVLKLTETATTVTAGQAKSGVRADLRSEVETLSDEYLAAKVEATALEERLKVFGATDHKICYKDIDSYLKKLGTTLSRKQLEHMIWEINENNDEIITWDEFQLTYYRNITDTTGNEPCAFFRILEFLTFDEHHKGYIIEDDCMEILFARHGSAKLEIEMQLLFGSNLRGVGGDGTLNMQKYLNSDLVNRTGRRALVT